MNLAPGARVSAIAQVVGESAESTQRTLPG
jgi:hypothetical protein